MTALIRALHFIYSENAHSPHLIPRSEVAIPNVEVLTSSVKAGFIAMGFVALCSFIATFSLLAFLTYRFIYWQHYYKRPLAENQYIVLIYNLLLIDIQQASSFMICLHWVTQGKVNFPSAACYLQGWWIQVGDPGSGLFVLAIAMHTVAVVLRGRQLPHHIFVGCIIGLWIFIIILGLIPVGLFGAESFVISEAGWCWLSSQHETERLWVHYFWIFLAEFGTLVLYGVMFFYIRRRMKQAAALQQRHKDNLNRLNRVVIYMVIYPLVYLVLSLPLAAGRMSTYRHVVPSKAYFAVAGTLMALSGSMDVLVYTLTRRHLLVETDQSTSDRIYAYSDSNVYETHISTRTPAKDSKKFRVRSRLRRGLQSIHETFNDNRDDSTEDIVRKGDMELGSMTNGVYQETTIEISHEPAYQDEQSQKQGRSSG